jgi:hypothetical protein
MSGISRAGPTKGRRGRPEDPRLLALDEELIPIVETHRPIGVRGVFYQAVVRKLVEKTESAEALIERRLLKLRRQGRVPYAWIVDESREVYGVDSYGGIADLADEVSALYRRDYWRDSDVWVQVWVEKRGLVGVLSPIVCNKWGLNLYSGNGQFSETYLYRAGLDIRNHGVETNVYMLSDFDPAGDRMYRVLVHGSKKAPGGLRRFTGDVPVHFHRLALTAEQVKAWNLPTRPAKEGDKEAKAFTDKHGNISVELDAIPPDDLRNLVDEAVSRHMPRRQLEILKAIEDDERDLIRTGLDALARVDEDEGGDVEDPS